jgi:hypothetical protein
MNEAVSEYDALITPSSPDPSPINDPVNDPVLYEDVKLLNDDVNVNAAESSPSSNSAFKAYDEVKA